MNEKLKNTIGSTLIDVKYFTIRISLCRLMVCSVAVPLGAKSAILSFIADSWKNM